MKEDFTMSQKDQQQQGQAGLSVWYMPVSYALGRLSYKDQEFLNSFYRSPGSEEQTIGQNHISFHTPFNFLTGWSSKLHFVGSQRLSHERGSTIPWILPDAFTTLERPSPQGSINVRISFVLPAAVGSLIPASPAVNDPVIKGPDPPQSISLRTLKKSLLHNMYF